MNNDFSTRREFLRRGLLLAASAPLSAHFLRAAAAATNSAGVATGSGPQAARQAVAITQCRSYAPAEVKAAMAKSLDLLGGIGPLVKDKTVTIKLNLTGTNFGQFLGRPVGETYMTHPVTVLALAGQLFAAGAKRVRLVESTNSRATLETSLGLAEWDVAALSALGKVEFENTRNLGSSKTYSHLKVPTGGYMFSAFDLNQAYEDTDVMISIAKLKNHVTAGVTLSMKNMFGITPNAVYGEDAGSEDATGGRGLLHSPSRGWFRKKTDFPGLKEGIKSTDQTWRIPRIVADVCSARPIHLAIIDGITSVSGGEGPWCGELKATSPGVIIVGLNPVSTDAVGVAVMGYPNPRAARGTRPFHFCDNHLLLAEEAGLGTADLARIDVRGLSLEKARCPYG